MQDNDDDTLSLDGEPGPGELASERQAGMTGAATQTQSEHEDNVSLDDLSPDTLIDDSGARSPYEPGADHPADQELSVVDESQVDLGIGLDEAELARSAPLDGEPWSDEVVTGEGEGDDRG